MNSHALAVLEYPRVLGVVAERASSSLGARRIRGAQPTTDLAWLGSEHRRVAAMRALVASEGGWSPESVPDLTEPLARLRVLGTVWSAPELLAGGAGIVLPDADPAGFAATLASLDDDPARRAALGTRAREEVGRRFALEQTADMLHALYREVGR